MLNLFSTNQSQRELKYILKFASIVFKSGPVNTRQESSAHRRRSQLTELDMSFKYKITFRGPRMDSCGTPQVRYPGEERFSQH